MRTRDYLVRRRVVYESSISIFLFPDSTIWHMLWKQSLTNYSFLPSLIHQLVPRPVSTVSKQTSCSNTNLTSPVLILTKLPKTTTYSAMVKSNIRSQERGGPRHYNKTHQSPLPTYRKRKQFASLSPQRHCRLKPTNACSKPTTGRSHTAKRRPAAMC